MKPDAPYTFDLPYTLTVGGEEYPINYDYRYALEALAAFSAYELSPANKQLAMLENIFGKPLPPGLDIAEAAAQAVWFLDGGSVVKGDNIPPKTMDYRQDAPMLFSAVNRVAGYDVRNPNTDTHWWTFLGYCNEISPDSPIAYIVHIRHKRATGERLDKHERKYYREHRHLIEFISADDDYEALMRSLGVYDSG